MTMPDRILLMLAHSPLLVDNELKCRDRSYIKSLLITEG